MDAAGAERADLFGHSEGGSTAVAFTAAYPERVERLILFASLRVCGPRTTRGHQPWRTGRRNRRGSNRRGPIRRESRSTTPRAGPTTPPSSSGLGRWLRLSASPKAAASLNRASSHIDVTDLLPRDSSPYAFAVPTGRPRREDRGGTLSRFEDPRARSSSSSRVPTTISGPVTPNRSCRRSRSSSPDTARHGTRAPASDSVVHRHRGLHRHRRQPWRPAVAPSSSAVTTTWSELSWRSGGARRSALPATGSWPRSTVRRRRFVAHGPLWSTWRRSGSRCAAVSAPR